jgi:hypothetical protein
MTWTWTHCGEGWGRQVQLWMLLGGCVSVLAASLSVFDTARMMCWCQSLSLKHKHARCCTCATAACASSPVVCAGGGRRCLEEAIVNFAGSVLVISHDRW